ncbi:Vacuolar protein sorting 4 [Carabus blaptoides fortunei]
METNNSLLNNENDDAIYSLYQEAVASFEQFDQAISTCKTENKPWSYLVYFLTICTDITNNMIHSETIDSNFSILLEIRDDLSSIVKILDKRNGQITFNDITITRLNPSTDPPPIILHHGTVNENRALEPVKFATTNAQEKLHNVIKNTIVVPKSSGLSTIAGMESTKCLLKEAVVLPIQYPHLFTGGRKPWNKALLYGPPGTGKTQFAHSLAAEINAQFYQVSNGDLLSHYVGESEKLIRTLFQHCQNSNEHCIIFIDEVDGICRKRNSEEAEYERRVKNELLNQLSNLDGNTETTIFFLAATNCPWDLDPAFIRRFQRRIYVPLPGRQTRLQIFKLLAKSNSIDDTQWVEILDKTEGWSGSDIADLVNCAMYQPIRTLDSATNWIITADDKYMPVDETEPMAIKRDIQYLPAHKITVRDVNINDYLTALRTVTKTVSYEDVKKYEEFNKNFGSLKNNFEE